jgi:K+/H+ antiporter YhaU regulatory subunit KhtT
LAEDVATVIRERVGAQEYLKAYNQVQQNAQGARLRRRHARAIQLVLDPKTAISERQNKTSRQRDAKKRKFEELNPNRNPIKLRRMLE